VPQLATEKCYRLLGGVKGALCAPDLKNDGNSEFIGTVLHDILLSLSSLGTMEIKQYHFLGLQVILPVVPEHSS